MTASLVNLGDQCVAEESRISLVPQTSLMNQKWIRTPCERECSTPCPEAISLESECSYCDQFPSVLLMSPKRSVVAPIPTTVVRYSIHHKRRLPNVPIPAGILRPKLQQPVCIQKPPPIQSSEQCPTIPAKPLEILAEEAIRTIRADGGKEETEMDTEHEDSHPVAAPRPGAMSCRRRGRFHQVVGHLMGCSSSASSASLLEHRALRTLATRKLCKQTREHFLTFFCQTQFAHPGRHADGCRSHNNQQRSKHVWMAAPMHWYPRHSRHGCGKRPRFQWCLRGWKLPIPGRS